MATKPAYLNGLADHFDEVVFETWILQDIGLYRGPDGWLHDDPTRGHSTAMARTINEYWPWSDLKNDRLDELNKVVIALYNELPCD